MFSSWPHWCGTNEESTKKDMLLYDFSTAAMQDLRTEVAIMATELCACKRKALSVSNEIS